MSRRPLIFLLLLIFPGVLGAQARPVALMTDAAEEVVFQLESVDPLTLRRADEKRVEMGREPHYAAVLEVDIDPLRNGSWQIVDRQNARWQLRLISKDALSLSLAFERFHMPPGGKLWISAADGQRIGPFTSADNEEHGQLWTPPLPTRELLLELEIPMRHLEKLELELSRVHHGYVGFGEPAAEKAGSCHSNVACADSDEWADAARSVGLVSIEGVRYCTGFLINNTSKDGRPYLITARHCGVHTGNAASVVVMWNYRRDCGAAQEQPWTRHFQSGAAVRAVDRGTDLVLLELDDPPSPEFGVYYAGWDRSGGDPLRTSVIHHPNTDVQRIAVDLEVARTTAYLQDGEQRSGDHLRIGDWEVGTTEGGSSGAPLFDENYRAVGVLHGGYAGCGVSRPDWFGRLSSAWDAGGSKATRLREWLDPFDTQVWVLDGYDPTLQSDAMSAGSAQR